MIAGAQLFDVARTAAWPQRRKRPEIDLMYFLLRGPSGFFLLDDGLHGRRWVAFVRTILPYPAGFSSRAVEYGPSRPSWRDGNHAKRFNGL